MCSLFSSAAIRTFSTFTPKSFHSSSSSSPPFSNNFISLFPKSSSSSSSPPFPSTGRRLFSIMSSADSGNGLHHQSTLLKGNESFLRDVLTSMESVYLSRNPTAKAILETVRALDHHDQICYDHIAFRTFGVNGHGIDSLANFFLDFGYTQRDQLSFPHKNLKAFWFSPPPNSHSGDGVNGPLPRVFISQLLVDQMTHQTQEIIRKYTESSHTGKKHAALASALGSLTWEKPSHSEFLQLARESEYAAWTLVNGYAVNHVTISTHRLKSHLKHIKNLNQFIEENGYKLNSEGGVLKVSPDGLLLQSSTLADSISFEFSDNITTSVPCSYIEFAERLVLPQFEHLPETEVKEYHRRDGFEVGNADKIFESTSKQQQTAKA